MGIRVNSINPGPIETNMVRDLEDTISRSDREKARKILESNIPMKRYGKPEEVAKLALFLASEESSFINGGVHTIDGGVSC
jgi:NAD(P)-dependent dehydrogenase (short-subunit alcohol dehydrogenase family)